MTIRAVVPPAEVHRVQLDPLIALRYKPPGNKTLPADVYSEEPDKNAYEFPF